MSVKSQPPHARRRSTLSSASNASQHSSDFVYECKAAYLVLVDNVEESLTSQKQLFQALQNVGRNPSKKMISKYWTSDTSKISFDEFVDICSREKPTTEDELMKAFKKIDVNGDGYLTNSELRKTLTTRGDPMSRDEVQAIIDEVDENKDGKLDYKEKLFNYQKFCKMVLGTQDECRKMAVQQMEKKLNKKKVTHKEASPKLASRREMLNHHLKDVREWKKASLASKDLKLSKPKRLKDWSYQHTKGCFYFDDDGSIVSHAYTLKLNKDTSVYITIEPYSLRQGADLNSSLEGTGPVDTLMFVLREDNSLVTFSEQRDFRGKFALRCDLERGSYRLVPFTSGCRFKQRKSEPNIETKLVKKDGKKDKHFLTKAFKDALGDIFDMSDLDGNGYLSRSEFNCFNFRTSGENVADSEWGVVEETVELKNGELTKNGFIELNQMEADDNQGETDDLWVTLSCMGFNKGLIMDEACPFLVEIFSEDCEGRLKVMGFATPATELKDAVIEATIGKGETSRIKEMKDLSLHSYITDHRGTFVVENKSHHKVSLEFNCSQSKNCVSNCEKGLDTKISVPAKQSIVAMHVMPEKESSDWLLRCHESVR